MIFALVLACHPSPSTQPIDPIPVVVSALAGGSVLASVAESDAAQHADAVGCWAWGSASFMTGEASRVLSTGGSEYPAITVDLSMCAGLMPITGQDVNATIAPVVHVSLGSAEAMIAAYAKGWSCDVRAHVESAVVYAQGWVDPVLDEVQNPDGVISVPATPIPACPPL